MPAERFYCDFSSETSMPVILTGQEHHHLVHVMRGKIGDQIELVNGRGGLAAASVQAINKQQVTLLIEKYDFLPQPQFRIILAQAIPRMPRLEFILEKGTELGMTDLWLFPGDRGEKKPFTDHQIQRMQTITVSAIKQCGRLYLPNIKMMPSLSKWKSLDFPLYFGDVNPEALSLLKALEKNPPQNGIIFCIGPESGFSDEENVKLKDLGIGVKLNEYILRTDTAALSALAILSIDQQGKV